MRDLVETVIGQVLKKQPTMKPLATQTSHKAQQTQQQPLVSLKGTHVQQPIEKKDEKLWDVCCQFESMFLQQMMSAMRKTIPESDFLPRGYADSVYDSMMDQAIAESGSKQAPLGLAMNMYRQLERDGQGLGSGAPSIEDIRKATDSIKKMNVVDNPTLGGV
ncbi:MAG: rod-binding protein [Ghiorsea sp.]|nr:rod-binding protein [Ghiorsea sp.]